MAPGLIAQLEGIMAHHGPAGGDPQTFKANSYRKAIRSLKAWAKENGGLDKLTRESYTGKNKIAGIGKRISEKLTQFLETGTIKKYEVVAAASAAPNPKRDLMGVPYIGSVAADDLVRRGYTLAKLRGLPARRLSTLLTAQQRLSLRYYEPLQTRIPRKAVACFARGLGLYLAQRFPSDSFEVLAGGSYRRGQKDSGDIDLVVKSSTFDMGTVVRAIEKCKMMLGILSQGGVDAKCICRCPGWDPTGQYPRGHPVRVDILFADAENWWASVIAYTGNDLLSRDLREKAAGRGWKLSSKGLLHNSEGRKDRVVPGGLQSEKHLWNLLGLGYPQPSERN